MQRAVLTTFLLIVLGSRVAIAAESDLLVLSGDLQGIRALVAKSIVFSHGTVIHCEPGGRDPPFLIQLVESLRRRHQ